MTKGYEQRKKSNKKYLEKFDEIKVRIPKGEKKEFQQLAKIRGKSLNSLIYELLKKELPDCQMKFTKHSVVSDIFGIVENNYEGPAVYALVDDMGKKYIGSTMNLETRLKFHDTHINVLLRDGKDGFVNGKMEDAILHGMKFHVEILEKLPYGISIEDLNNKEYYYLEKEGGCDSTYNMQPIKLK